MDKKNLFSGDISCKGFFKSYYQDLIKVVEKGALSKFEKLKTDEERIRFVDELVIPGRELEVEWEGNGKDETEAKKLKECGNKAFAKGDNEEALKLYTESMLRMPQDQSTSDLAVIVANRSACLYHIQEYESAIKDIDYAFSMEYPKKLRYKIHERKAKCLLAEQKHEEAISEFRKTLQALDDSELTTEKKRKMQTDIQIMLGVMTKPKTKSGHVNMLTKGQKKEKKRDPELSLCSNRNKVYTSICDKVEIREGPDVGRYAAAVENIRPGEVLLLEKPYCSVLLGEYCHTHCQHCFKRTLVVYPCRNCSQVVFCSEKCREQADASYHKYECPILETVISSGASVTVLMALRIVTQNPVNFFLNLKGTLSDTRKEFTKYESSDYEALYHLIRHDKLRKTDDFFERTVMALFLLQCLKKAKYFENGVSPSDEHYIGSLILRHLQLLQFNAHEIFEVELKQGQKLEQKRSVFIGGGIYTTLSLFNHSCDPGVVRYFNGTTAVVRSIKTIPKGEVVAENYGPIFTVMKREERRKKLKSQYWFECGCRPCTENWPGFDDMDGKILRFRCDSRREDGQKSNACTNVIAVPQSTNEFMAKCLLCGQHTNILKGLKILQDTDAMYRQASRDADAGNYQSALGIYLEILTMLDDVMAPPFRDYHLCQQAIRECMLCCGNKFFTNT